MMSDKVNNKNFFSEIITENYIDREIYFQKEYWRGWVKHWELIDLLYYFQKSEIFFNFASRYPFPL